MNFIAHIGDSFGYSREALVGHWRRWILLGIGSIIFPFLLGYLLEILRGKVPAPEPAHWGRLFIDGLVPVIILWFYTLPAAVAFFAMNILAFQASMSDSPAAHTVKSGYMVIGIPVIGILFIFLGFLAVMGTIRYARKGDFLVILNLGGILNHLGKAGLKSCMLALVVPVLVVATLGAIFYGIMLLIPPTTLFLIAIVIPPSAIFLARYLTLFYDIVPEGP